MDASAILCVLFNEPGAAQVQPMLDGAYISAVNLSEVLAKVIERGDDPDLAIADLNALGLTVMPFDGRQAESAGRLRASTRSAGLSLGDRACLALAAAVDGPAVTCDRAWTRIASDAGVLVELAR